jgi:hypothetical protein
VPGAPESAAHVSIDIPRGVVLNHWQSRVLRVASRVIALLQFLDPARGELAGSDAWQSGTASPETAAPLPSISESAAASPPTPDDAPVAGTAWQKIVVRYAEGQILKGFTQDFSAMRSQFSLWPSITAAPQERVIVPLARLKAVFFVRDFAGNPGYVERTDGGELQHGRRIEVTLIDDEVIVGRTLMDSLWSPPIRSPTTSACSSSPPQCGKCVSLNRSGLNREPARQRYPSPSKRALDQALHFYKTEAAGRPRRDSRWPFWRNGTTAKAFDR